MRLFIDMDGVLTDFDKQAAKLFNVSVDEVQDYLSSRPKYSWFKIDRAGKDFWSKMDWTSDGKQLWESLAIYRPTILSSPSKHPSSREGKKEWIGNEIGDIPIILDSNKARHVQEKCCVLIDDREDNIEKWEKAGGTGILHKNTRDTLKKLKELMATGKYSNIQAGSMDHIIEKMDKVASDLEAKGLIKEAEEIDVLTNTIEVLAGKKKKWIQEADVEEGKFEKWCKANGFEEGVCQSCINKAAEKGGDAARMANFAVNVSKGKYHYPEKKKDEK